MRSRGGALTRERGELGMDRAGYGVSIHDLQEDDRKQKMKSISNDF